MPTKEQITAGYDALHAHETYYDTIDHKPDKATKKAWQCSTCSKTFPSSRAGDEHLIEEIIKATENAPSKPLHEVRQEIP